MSVANPRRRVVPVIPTAVLERHQALEPGDGRFKAAARLMQSLWREQRGYQSGRYVDRHGKPRRLGSRLPAAVAHGGANFLNPEIVALAHREIAYREIAAVIDTKRLFANLLSSQTLTFNLLGPLKLNLELATTVFKRLFPDFCETVDDIWFEHSPGRGRRAFTDDHTAFDALVLCHTVRGGTGFIALEVKYSEGTGTTPLPSRSRYEELSQQSGLYRDPKLSVLRSGPLQQFWREHMLAQSMLQAKLYDEGMFVVTAPGQNHECDRAVTRYREQLAESSSSAAGFAAVSIEAIIDAIERAGAVATAQALRERYFDFTRVDRALFQVISGGQEATEPVRAAA